jgi:hypothetical protein
MKFNEQLLDELTRLVVLSMEDGLDKENHQRLEDLLEGEPLARKYYFRLINIHLGMLEPNNLKVLHGQSQNIPNDIELWKALAENEKSEDGLSGVQTGDESNVSLRGVGLEEIMVDVDADDADDSDMLEILELVRTSPAVEIEKEEPVKPKRELIQKVVHAPREKRKLTKFQKFFFTASAAAVLFFVFLVKFSPEPVPSVAVATVSDQMNVKWSESSYSLETGERLWTKGFPLDIKEGIVSIEFDEGVKVVIEGPALFEIERRGIYLEYGRL